MGSGVPTHSRILHRIPRLCALCCLVGGWAAMLWSFLRLGAVSPGRQLALRRAIAVNLVVLSCGALAMRRASPQAAPMILGQLLLVVGIVEGAILIGWRLTQMPKSQA